MSAKEAKEAAIERKMRELHGESYAMMRKKPAAKEPIVAPKEVNEVKPIDLKSNV